MPFRVLIEQSLAAIEPLGCTPLVLPRQYAQITRPELDGELVMDTQFMAVADKGELRWVHIYAPKINVLTLFFFPNPQWQLPVYCMEQVIFGNQPIIAMLDAVCLASMACHEKIDGWLQKAHQANPQLQQAQDTPEWFEQCRSGQDFFIRPENDHYRQMISHLHLRFLESLSNWLVAAEAFDGKLTGQHRHALQAYKNHHRIHAPGLKLMNRSFGEQWTDTYMNFLFK